MQNNIFVNIEQMTIRAVYRNTATGVAVIKSYKVRRVGKCSIIDKFDWNSSVCNAHQS